jgi:hypothetical protein
VLYLFFKHIYWSTNWLNWIDYSFQALLLIVLCFNSIQKILSTLLLSRAQVVEKQPETVDDHSLMRWVCSINYSQWLKLYVRALQRLQYIPSNGTSFSNQDFCPTSSSRSCLPQRGDFDFDNVSNPSEDQDEDTPVPAKSRYYLVLKNELEVMSSTFNVNYQYC